MTERISFKVWLIIGVTLDVAGGLVIFFSLPEAGDPMWIGLGLVVLGSIAIRQGINRLGEAGEVAPAPDVSRGRKSADLEAELLGQRPRQVELTTRGKMVLGVWVLMLAVFGAMAYQHFHRLPPPRAKSLLSEQGLSAIATIGSAESRRIEDGRILYTIAYQFTDETGSTIRSRLGVPEAVARSVAQGQKLEVIYLPPDPGVNYLPQLTSPVPDAMVWLVGGLLIATAGFSDAQRRAHRQLVAQGEAVSGFVANVRRRGAVRSFIVNYNVGDERRSLSASERNAGLKNGQSATVLYDPVRPGRAVIYRLALYRAS